MVGAGDHLLVPDSVYAPTRHFCDTAGVRFGFETTYYEPAVGGGIEALFRPNTKAVFTESPGSHTFEIQDIPAIAAAAHRHGALVIMDNTWATPLFFKPLAMGVGSQEVAAPRVHLTGLPRWPAEGMPWNYQTSLPAPNSHWPAPTGPDYAWTFRSAGLFDEGADGRDAASARNAAYRGT